MHRQHVCRAGTKKGRGGKEGSKEKGEEKQEKKKHGDTVPPRLSLSAGFTWIGLFICDREKERKQITKKLVSVL